MILSHMQFMVETITFSIIQDGNVFTQLAELSKEYD